MTQVREILGGRYELLDVLGRGGMGIVYRARDQVLDRIVAVKVLPAGLAEEGGYVARFEREARTVAALSHPNVVAVFDTGRDGDTRYIVMQCAPGRSLAQLLREQGRLPAGTAVAIATQIADALAAAHRAGVIHRDVKPANVIVDDAGAVKVLDFGIARVIGGTSLTRTAVVLGSAPYLAPEVARGEGADERSDVYSLGCVLYEMLAGRPPFTGELAAAIMHQHSTVPPRPVSALNPLVPAALEALAMRMLSKRSRDRPGSAEEVRRSLQAQTAAPWTDVTRVLRRRRAATSTEVTRVLGRRRGDPRALIAAALAAVILTLVIFALAGSSSSGRHAPSRGRATAAGNAGQKSAAQATRSTASTTPPATTAASQTQTTSPPSVPVAAGALTSLITQDLQSGGIDQHGQDLLGQLQDILQSVDQGNTNDALHKVDDFAKHLADLSGHGDVQPLALPALDAAIGNLRAAIQSARPATGGNGPGGGGGDGQGGGGD